MGNMTRLMDGLMVGMYPKGIGKYQSARPGIGYIAD